MKPKREITAENTKVVSEEEAYWTEIVEALDMEVKNIAKKLRYTRFCLENARKELERSHDP